MAEDTRQYTDFYAQAGKLICERSCEVMNAPRAEALQAFPALGFPTTLVLRLCRPSQPLVSLQRRWNATNIPMLPKTSLQTTA